TLAQRINKLDVAVPAQAEGVRHLLLDQIIDDDLSAVEFVARHINFTPESDRNRSHVEDDEPLVGHFKDGIARTFAANTTIFNAAIGQLIDAPGRRAVDDDPAGA